MSFAARPARSFRSVVLPALVLLAPFGAACAAGLDVGGSLRGGLWSRSRSLDAERDIATASVWGAADWRPHDRLAAHLDGWLREESRDRSDAYRHSKVREAYVSATLQRWQLRLGKQIIAWGRADAINPTDRLIRRDYTLLTPDDADQREGIEALRVRRAAGPVDVTVVWAPRFQTSRIALPPLPQVRYDAREPARRDQFAVRLESSGRTVEWSVSYFDGADAVPDLSLARVDAAGAVVALTNRRVRVWGADIGTTVGSYALRAEAGWSVPEASPAPGFDAKREQLFVVVGGDRNVTSSLNANVQYFAQKVRGFRHLDEIADPLLRSVASRQAATANQTRGFQQGVTLRLGGRWWNDALEAETSLVCALTTRSHVWRAKASYAIDDRWRMVVGFDRFRGPDDTFLGQLRANSTVYAELRRTF